MMKAVCLLFFYVAVFSSTLWAYYELSMGENVNYSVIFIALFVAVCFSLSLVIL